METFDYIIVGAGTAGCLIANRLSANPNLRILLLEAGKSDNYHWIHIPVGYLYCMGNPRTDWLFKTEAQAGLHGRSLGYPRGKVLGGSSSINGMIYMRGQARDYDTWAKLTGDDEWRWERSLADFKAHESHYRLDGGADPVISGNARFSDIHGGNGEWRIEKQRLNWSVLDTLHQAMIEAGIPRADDFNTGENEGSGFYEVTQRNGLRWNASKAFLRPVKNRKNLEVWTEAQAMRLVFDRSEQRRPRCKGVLVHRQGREIEVQARHEVILCAGAVGSPQLLQLSGIGDVAQLQAQGIEAICERVGVGANLQDHLQIRVVFRVSNTTTLNETSQSLWGKAKIAAEYALWRTGPMSMSPSQLGAVTRSHPRFTHPNIQYHVQPLSLDAFGEPLHSFPAITVTVCNLNPTSRGSISLRSSDWRAPPVIAPNYLNTAEDKQVAAESIRHVRSVVAQPAMARLSPEEYRPGAQYQSDEELVHQAGLISTTIFHPVGTTKMGREDDPAAVVDSRLRLHGVSGLRVADAGVMPLITSGNTNAPTLMIAEKAARFIAQEHKLLASGAQKFKYL